MFEFSLIRQYLIPQKKQLSASIIALISVFVIALVVWLVLVFLSVTNGMEKKWTEKLIALSAPIQITPRDAYYDSYYYHIDSISQTSSYTNKTIGEKLASTHTNPYNDNTDSEPLAFWRSPDLTEKGDLRDLVKDAFEAIHSITDIKGLRAADYELTLGNARIRLLRSTNGSSFGPHSDTQNFLSQLSYIASFDPVNNRLNHTLLTPSMNDFSNLFSMLSLSSDNIKADQPGLDPLLSKDQFQKRLQAFLAHLDITHLKSGPLGYPLSRSLFPKKAVLKACLISIGDKPLRLLIPKEAASLSDLKKRLNDQGFHTTIAPLKLDHDTVTFNNTPLPDNLPWFLENNVLIPAALVKNSIPLASDTAQLQFAIDTHIQSIPLKGELFYRDLLIGKAQIKANAGSITPPWIYHDINKLLQLPLVPEIGEGILLPKSYKDNDVLLGDRGYLSYHAQGTTTTQEQRVPVFVAGFYDPGLIPIGSKLILAPQALTNLIASSTNLSDPSLGNGIHVYFDDFKKADQIKTVLLQEFEKRHISPYWKIQTYKEYDFAKDFIEQVSSDKMLYTLIAVIIILVACTNIVSMLILLVNDKKIEIGILQAMGATRTSLALVFGFCGMCIGLFSSFVGTMAAFFTLKYIDFLVTLLSRIQGHQIFNPLYFGDSLPRELSSEALIFVLIATITMSLLAGLVPALKASRIHPTNILKAE